MTFIEKKDFFDYYYSMSKGGNRIGSGRKAIAGKEIKLKLPYELIETVDGLYAGSNLNDKVRMSIADGVNAKLNNYGVVYTPNYISDFVVFLLAELIKADEDFKNKECLNILDPACGECSLLYATKRNEYFSKRKISLFANDVDDHYKEIALNNAMTFTSYDALTPSLNPVLFWKKKMKRIDIMIENPPWSSEKVYDRSHLAKLGYSVAVGQYDAYSLFIELSLKAVSDNGYCAFIIPDSVFTSEDSTLRDFIFNNSDVKVIARLGEKLFPNVHRSAAVLICKKAKTDNNLIRCFRLGTNDRKEVIDGNMNLIELFKSSSYFIEQNRLSEESSFSIDIKNKDVELIQKIKTNKISLSRFFKFGRGIEIAKKENLVLCPHCDSAQGYSNNNEKKCIFCGKTFSITSARKIEIISNKKKPCYSALLVGENIQRYRFDGCRYLSNNAPGVVIKKECIDGKTKLLVRKTGLGIKAVVEDKNRLYTQTVYSLTPISSDVNAYYFLGLLNSRVLYYFHIKTSGENEWKSHPYITKQTLFNFPFVDPYSLDSETVEKISSLAKSIMSRYDKETDMELESAVFDIYRLNSSERKKIIDEINNLPDIGVFNEMKVL